MINESNHLWGTCCISPNLHQSGIRHSCLQKPRLFYSLAFNSTSACMTFAWHLSTSFSLYLWHNTIKCRKYISWVCKNFWCLVRDLSWNFSGVYIIYGSQSKAFSCWMTLSNRTGHMAVHGQLQHTFISHLITYTKICMSIIFNRVKKLYKPNGKTKTKENFIKNMLWFEKW